MKNVLQSCTYLICSRRRPWKWGSTYLDLSANCIQISNKYGDNYRLKKEQSRLFCGNTWGISIKRIWFFYRSPFTLSILLKVESTLVLCVCYQTDCLPFCFFEEYVEGYIYNLLSEAEIFTKINRSSTLYFLAILSS